MGSWIILPLMRCWILNQATNWHQMFPYGSIWIQVRLLEFSPIAESPVVCSPTSRDFLWIYSPRQHRIGLSVQRFSNIIQYLVIEVEWVYTWRLVGTVSKNAGQENCSGSVPWHPGDHSTVISNQIVGLFGDPCLFGIRIRGFPKMLLPPNHPNFNNFNRILHYKPSSSWGAPMMENLHFCRKFHCFVKWSPSLGESMEKTRLCWFNT